MDSAISYASELISQNLNLEISRRKEIQKELLSLLKVSSDGFSRSFLGFIASLFSLTQAIPSSVDPATGPITLEADQINSFGSLFPASLH